MLLKVATTPSEAIKERTGWGKGLRSSSLGIHRPSAFASGGLTTPVTSALGTVALDWTPSHLPRCPEGGWALLGQCLQNAQGRGRERRGEVRRGKPLDGKESSRQPLHPRARQRLTHGEGNAETNSRRQGAGWRASHRGHGAMRMGLLFSASFIYSCFPE